MAEEPLDKKIIHVGSSDKTYICFVADIKESMRLVWDDIAGRYSIRVQKDFQAILKKRLGPRLV